MSANLLPGSALPWKAGGDFTIYRQVKTMGLAELESKVGYHKGRLSNGAILAVMASDDIAALASSDFTLGASSRWSRSQAAAPWAPEFTKFSHAGSGEMRMEVNAIESRLALEGKDPQALKDKVIRFFRLGGDNRPAKVFPNDRHEDWMTYPNAEEVGIPQFRLHNAKSWVVMRVFGPA